MALFDRGADDALIAAIAMLQQLHAFNEQRIEIGEAPIRIGIGANSGLLMLGTIGGHDRMDSTVISDAVNVVARIENLTKTYQVPLLISEHTRSRIAASRALFDSSCGQCNGEGEIGGNHAV